MNVYGVDMEELEEGTMAVEILAVVKALDHDGNMVFEIKTSEGLTDIESLGMLRAATMIQEDQVRSQWEGEE